MTAPADEKQALAHTLRIYDAYRRSLLYVVFGGWAALAVGLALAQQPPDPLGVVAGVILVGVLLPLFWIYVSTYRLVLDDEGLSRRRFWFWTHWPWEDFSAGHVHWDNKNGFLTNRARPFWDRWNLSLPFLEPDKGKFVSDIIERMCPASSISKPLKPPASVQQLDLSLLLSFKLQITSSGCTWLKNGELILWREIEEFRIERTRVKGQCFYQLKMKAGNKSYSGPITSVRIDESWLSPRNDVREAWLSQLRGLVPERCFVYFRADGELASIEEGEFRLKYIEDQLPFCTWFERIGWALLPICAIAFGPRIPGLWNVPFMALGWKLIGVGACLLMIVQPTLMIVPVIHFLRANLRERQAETRRQMAALVAAEVKSPAPAAVHAA